jgi:hypothetical protein
MRYVKIALLLGLIASLGACDHLSQQEQRALTGGAIGAGAGAAVGALTGGSWALGGLIGGAGGAAIGALAH